jgi:uncharacterized membrane protein YqgA involved in biofilm formation
LRGTLVNAGAILGGSFLGLAMGPRLPDRVKGILMQALGLSVLVLGLRMALSGRETLLPVGCLLLGGITGELADIEGRLERMGEWVRDRLRFGSETFAEGFASATLLYLTGAMMIVGSIRDGIAGDPTTLHMKALLDGVAAVALASSLGAGVAFSAFSVLAVQGAITLLASRLLFLQRPEVLGAVTATGGFLIAAIGINLLDLRRLRTGNLLPAVFYAIAAALLGLG